MSMTWEEYQDQVKADALDVIESEYSDYEDWDEMSEALFIDDSVTGNGSGSYTFCTATAAENVAGIIFDPEAVDAFREYGYNGIPTEKGAEACDVIARCIALGYVGYDLEKRFDELKEENDPDSDAPSAWAYCLEDSHEAPQCGVNRCYFQDWDGVEAFLAENPDVAERIADGYALIREND